MSKNIYGKYIPSIKTNTGGLDIMVDTLEIINTVNEISTDTTLADNSDIALVTEKVVKTYVGANDEWLRLATMIYPKNTGDTLGIDSVSSESGLGSVDFPNDLKTDIISESTGATGVTIDSVLLKDNEVTATNLIANTAVQTDSVIEKTGSAGVTIDDLIVNSNIQQTFRRSYFWRCCY